MRVLVFYCKHCECIQQPILYLTSIEEDMLVDIEQLKTITIARPWTTYRVCPWMKIKWPSPLGSQISETTTTTHRLGTKTQHKTLPSQADIDTCKHITIKKYLSSIRSLLLQRKLSSINWAAVHYKTRPPAKQSVAHLTTDNADNTKTNLTNPALGRQAG